MPSAVIIGNICRLTVNARRGDITIDMSLQRHHYRYCGSSAAAAVNSLLYAKVADTEVITDVLEVGASMEKLLNKSYRPKVLFGEKFRAKSGRIYLVDNTGLQPNQFPNHFFPTSGPMVWGQMSQNEFVAARAIRRVEAAIDSRPVKSRGDYLNGKKLHKIKRDAGTDNPVIAEYTAARTALNQVPEADNNLELVSGHKDIVTLTRSF